jgi:CDP-diacylglycerol--serine O-phosphatidyltransferase
MDKQTLKRSGQVIAPSLFTMGNMACGFYALLSAHRGEFTVAATAILLGIVFDALDGRVARLVHGETAFGVEFDSLSDFLTFGVAPAHMMYAFILKDYGALGYPMAFLFALCGALRLARFNAVAHDTGGSKTNFTGLPIPAGAGFLASFVLLYQIVEEGKPVHTWKILMNQVPSLYGLVPLMVVALAFLMVSTIPYPAYKSAVLWEPPLGNGDNGRSSILPPRRVMRLLLFFIVGLVIFIYPQNTIFMFGLYYVLSGPAMWLWRFIIPGAKAGSEAPPPEPDHRS